LKGVSFMKILLITLVILGLAGIDGWPLVRDTRWKELTVYILLLLLGLGIIIMDMTTYEPFRITTAIDYVFRPYFAVVREFLQQLLGAV
jgi:hypothetical protein